MNIVIPMAGFGSRFAKIGITTPKPLIDVRGRPMYAWATESLPLHLASRLIFICLREHLIGTTLEADIYERYGAHNPTVLSLEHVTQGQACTVLVAEKFIAANTPLMIFNADTYCRTNLDKTLAALGQSVAGLLGVFEAPGERWSFARTDESGRVVETSEKRRISNHACTGLYYFSHGSDFVRYARNVIADNDRVNGEFYVAPIYNRMIADGLDIRIDVAEEAFALGTPEDLQHFLANFRGT